jgi:D-xylose transport system substrate-binding protein
MNAMFDSKISQNIKITKMSKIIVFILLAFLVLVTCSCSQNSNSVTVGFMVHTLQDERWSIERDIIIDQISKLGGKVLFNNAENDERLQYHQAVEMINKGVQVLIVSPVNSKTAASIVRLCHENGVKIIAYDIIIENSKPDLYISFDNEKIGEQMALFALSKCKRGNYVLMWGDGGMKISHWIKDGQLEMLNPYIKDENISIVYQSFTAGWSAENSCMLMKKIIDLYDQKIDVVIASSDGIAQGVINAYLDRGITSIPIITGQDACKMAIENIENGLQSMSVSKSFNDLAVVAAQHAILIANNQKIETEKFVNNGRCNVPSILLETSIYTK